MIFRARAPYGGLPTDSIQGLMQYKNENVKLASFSTQPRYGSCEAFEAFVRGPLRKELLSSQLDTQLPAAYSFMLVTPLLALGLDTLAGMILGCS